MDDQDKANIKQKEQPQQEEAKDDGHSTEVCGHDEPEEHCSDHTRHYSPNVVYEHHSPGAFEDAYQQGNVDMVQVSWVNGDELCNICCTDKACNLKVVDVPDTPQNYLSVQDAKGKLFVIPFNAVLAYMNK